MIHMGEECDVDNSSPHFCPYLPGKRKTGIYYLNVPSASPTEKGITKVTACNSCDILFKPMNVFSRDLRNIDLELKNMHRMWSNID